MSSETVGRLKQPAMKVGIDPSTPRVCELCKRTLPVSSFAIGGGHYYTSKCKECHGQIEHDRYHGAYERFPELDGTYIDKYWNKRVKALETNARYRGLPFDLTVEDLKNCYEKQGGLCYYTGKPMLVSSIDRIDHEKGYSKDNIVICEYSINNVRKLRSQPKFIEMCVQVAMEHGGLVYPEQQPL